MTMSSTIKSIHQRLEESYVTLYACILATVLHFVSDAFYVYWFGQGLLSGLNPIFLLAHAVLIGGIIGISTNYDQRHDFSLKAAIRQVTGLELACFALLIGFKVSLLTSCFPFIVLSVSVLALFWTSYRYFPQSKHNLNVDQCLLAASCIAVMGLVFGYGCQLGFGVLIGIGLTPLTLGLSMFIGWLLLDVLGLEKFTVNQQVALGLGMFITATVFLAVIQYALPFVLFFSLPAIGFYLYNSWCQHQFKPIELAEDRSDVRLASSLKNETPVKGKGSSINPKVNEADSPKCFK